jgi:hypothetical protein
VLDTNDTGCGRSESETNGRDTGNGLFNLRKTAELDYYGSLNTNPNSRSRNARIGPV